MKSLIRAYFLSTFVFVGIQSLFRIVFYFLYVPSQSMASSDFIKAFLLGIRFDFTVAAYIQSIPLLLLFIYFLFTNKIGPRVEKALQNYYLLMLIVLLMINIGDLFFYSYFQDRLNVLIFGFFEDDTIALLKTIWSDYPVIKVFLLISLVVFAVSVLFKRLLNLSTNLLLSSRWFLLTTLFAVFIFNGVVARGSFALFPLSEMDLEVTQSAELNLMAYNSTRAFARAFELRTKSTTQKDLNLRGFGYQDKVSQAVLDYFGESFKGENELGSASQSDVDLLWSALKQTPQRASNLKSPHVVLVLLEGWGAYWLRFANGSFDLVGNFKTHLEQDFLTPNCLPSTGATIGSLSSLMAGLPHRYQYNFLSESSDYRTAFRTSPARIYAQNGYETKLIYGGNTGWRELAKFARAQGYQYVAGDHEIATKLKREIELHPWGVHDQDLFDYVYGVLQEAEKPQFIVVMTTTNHPPFVLPKEYKIPDLVIPDEMVGQLTASVELAKSRFAAYRYGMDVFADFMGKLKASSIGERTLVAASGDHNFWMIKFSEEQVLEKHAVPFYLYLPEKFKEGTSGLDFRRVYCSHQDMLPTLYERSLKQGEYWSFGRDVFDPHRDNFAFDGMGLALAPEGAVFGGRDLKPKAEDPAAQAVLEKLKTRYQALHSLMDFYFEQEKGE
ncbi:MAG: LTA synthase family protein [Bdellovibrionia bacterium]